MPNSGIFSTCSAPHDKIYFCLHPSAGRVEARGPVPYNTLFGARPRLPGPGSPRPTDPVPHRFPLSGITSDRCVRPPGPEWTFQQGHRVLDGAWASPTSHQSQSISRRDLWTPLPPSKGLTCLWLFPHFNKVSLSL